MLVSSLPRPATAAFTTVNMVSWNTKTAIPPAKLIRRKCVGGFLRILYIIQVFSHEFFLYTKRFGCEECISPNYGRAFSLRFSCEIQVSRKCFNK